MGKRGGKARGGKGAMITKAVKKGKDLLTGKKTGGTKRKKSALWYAKEIQRLKLKRKYEKTKYGVLK